MRGDRIYYRRRVPDALRTILDQREVWRSLGTDSPTVALRRSHAIAAAIEHEFEVARLRVGLPVDQTLLAGLGQEAGTTGQVVEPASSDIEAEVAAGATLGELYDAYMADPTRDWSPTTRMAYQATRRVVVAILGEHTPVRSITRTQCRDMIEALRWQPRNAANLNTYPASSRSRDGRRAPKRG